jgi:hypothetical protein
MKVEVLQVEQAKFSKYRWWSNWVDIAVYDYECTPFLLQMSVNKFNKKRFRSVRMTGTFKYRQASCSAIGDLLPMKPCSEYNQRN